MGDYEKILQYKMKKYIIVVVTSLWNFPSDLFHNIARGKPLI